MRNVLLYNLCSYELFTVPPENVAIHPSKSCLNKDNVVLNCSADGFPQVNYTWTQLKFSNVTNGSLITVTGEDTYICTAFNIVANLTRNQTANITVYNCRKYNLLIIVSNVRLECIQWHKWFEFKKHYCALLILVKLDKQLRIAILYILFTNTITVFAALSKYVFKYFVGRTSGLKLSTSLCAIRTNISRHT